MSKHERVVEREDGWSDWIQPVMDGYRMVCCDCGLVHEMKFRALRRGKDLPNGKWAATPLDTTKYRVELKARRHRRSTAAVRRWKREAAE